MILVAAFVTLRATETTTAAARVMLIGKQPETPVFSQYITEWDLELSSAAQVVMSLPVARMATESLWDTLSASQDLSPGIPAFASADDVLESLVNQVSCSQVGESNILSITYSHMSAEYALLVVKHIMNAYMSFNIQSRQNLPAVEYYSEQIDNLHVEIDDLFQRRADIVNQEGVKALVGNSAIAVGQIQQLETNMFNVRSERKALEARLRSIEAAIANDPSFIPSSVPGEGTISETLKERLDILSAELADMRSQFREGTGRLEFKERQLAEIWKELDNERMNLLQALRVSINELAQREHSLMESILQQESRLADYPDIQRRIDAVDVQISSQLELLRNLETKRGEVKLKAGSDMRISNILPLDDPYIKISLVGGKKNIYLAMAIILSLMLGLIAGWFVDSQDHRIYDRSQAMKSLRVPVLGAISSDQPEKQ
jgi:uncharacterized protein involved in exopolysaccharide biosynthesis